MFDATSELDTFSTETKDKNLNSRTQMGSRGGRAEGWYLQIINKIYLSYITILYFAEKEKKEIYKI